MTDTMPNTINATIPLDRRMEYRLINYMTSINIFRIICVLGIAVIFAACSSRQALEDAPIITSASYQHTLYNGKGQPIEATTAKEDSPPLVVTYFNSKADLEADLNGSAEAPSEVGVYFVRISRPAGNGYKAGPDITVEYHIQKALVTP